MHLTNTYLLQVSLFTSTFKELLVAINAVEILAPTLTVTSQQGSVVVPNDAVAPTGLSITSAVGFVEGTGSVVVPITGISMSASIGTIVDIPDQIMGLTGVSFSSAIGSVDPKDQVVGLPTLTMTATVGDTFYYSLSRC